MLASFVRIAKDAQTVKYFQNFNDEESLRLKKPSLPQSFGSISEAEQEEALEQYRRRQLH